MNSEVSVVILAAGLGTRMKSGKAKVLHEAGGETILNHVIRAALHVAPAAQVVAVVGHQAQEVRESVRFAGVKFAEQTQQKGTGHAVMCAREAVGANAGQLLILNGDGPLLQPSTLQNLVEFPADGGKLLTTRLSNPHGYGRIVRNEQGQIAAIVEQKSASTEQLKIQEVNAGVYCFDAKLFWRYLEDVKPDKTANEYFLTDVVEILSRHGHAISPMVVADETELLGINTKIELAVADRILRERKAHAMMTAGVTIENPGSVLIDVDVEVGADTILEANVHLRGSTSIGKNCRVGTGSVLRNCKVGDDTMILPYVVAQDSTIGRRATVGPFARLRLQSYAADDTLIGNFVELKKAKLGRGSKASHLAYLGDAEIGIASNIGAGTITCNYDGANKHLTQIGDGVFVGSNSTLVAPLTLGDGSFVAAGSVITKTVAKDALAIGRAHQAEKPLWAKRRRQSQKLGDQ